jgi:hypothetical protein
MGHSDHVLLRVLRKVLTRPQHFSGRRTDDTGVRQDNVIHEVYFGDPMTC